MSVKEKAHIMDEAAMERALVRIAHQIVEKNHGTDHLCLVGSPWHSGWAGTSPDWRGWTSPLGNWTSPCTGTT